MKWNPKALAQAETRRAPKKPDWPRWHFIAQYVGQTYEEARAAYGEDRIAEGDKIWLNQFVRPGSLPNDDRQTED